MLTENIPEEQFKMIESAVNGGLFVRRKMFIWQGTLVELDKRLTGGKIKRCRKYNLPEFKKSFLIKKEINQCFYDFTYKTLFGAFVPERSIEPFSEEIKRMRGKIKDISNLFINERPRLIENLEKNSYRYAYRLWNGMHYENGSTTPSESFVANVGRSLALSFPEENDLRRKFRLNVVPCNPICQPGSQYEKFFGSDLNSQVVMSVHNSLIYKRAASFRSLMFLMDRIEYHASQNVKSKLKKVLIATMFSVRSISRNNFIEDEFISEVTEKLLDHLIIEDERDLKYILSTLASIAKYLYDNNTYIIRHIVDCQRDY